jgi:CHRD domain
MATLFIAVLSLACLIGVSPALAAEGLSAQLNGYEETPATLNTAATGVFVGLLNDAETEIPYQLFYTGLTGNILFAHIHLGKPGESGGIAAFLCGGGGKPACPPNGSLFVGVLTSADVAALAAQNLPANDMAAFVRAIKMGFTYVNVHTSTFMGGQVRGQIKSSSR